ncbi:MAG: IS1595 family transposase, partial [Thermodesulfobacteriota bacterium]
DTYIGGKHKGKRGRGAEGKTPVFGMVERKGDVKAKVVDNLKKKTVKPLIENNIEQGSQVYTDEFLPYADVEKYGFNHDVIKHQIKEYVRGNVHTNTLEGFWSQLKRSIHGTYHSVSPKHLQLYVDEFAFRYNYRFSGISIFDLLLQKVVV